MWKADNIKPETNGPFIMLKLLQVASVSFKFSYSSYRTFNTLEI